MLKRMALLIGILALAIVIWIVFGRGFACGGPVALVLLAVALWLVTPHIGGWVNRTGPRLWLLTGVLALTAQFVPAALVADSAGWLPPVLRESQAVSLLLIMLSPLAVPTAGMLLFAGAAEYRRNGPWRAAAACFALCGLLVGLFIYHTYWLLAWDQTTDSLGIIWLVLPILAALLTGVVLLAALPGRWRPLVLYAFVVPALLIGTYALAGRVTFRQRTQARAEQVSAALAHYYAREGRYPDRLRQLVPRDTLNIPAPMIISGQGWCYASDGGSYQLAYIDREHWSAPGRFASSAASAGDTTGLPPACEQELADLARRQ